MNSSPFDVVVVGAGSAGCVLASRLAESGGRSVGLIEAGADRQREAGEDPPRSAFDAVEDQRLSWRGLQAVPSPGSARFTYPAGRGIGGTSLLNGMLAAPGLAEDYDEWELAGAIGWGWPGLSPWFTRTRLALRAAGTADVGPLGAALVAALPAQAGGAMLAQFPDGSRAGIAERYLGGPADRNGCNLTIIPGATVERLLLDGRRCAGVVLADGRTIEAGETIVSAGALGSPALLLRTGCDTPGIGANLCEHPGIGIGLIQPHGGNVSPLGRRPAIAVLARMSSGEEAADLQLVAIEQLGAAAASMPMLLLGLMRSWSRGSLALGPHGVGVIANLDLLSDPRDLRRLRVGIEQLGALLASRSFAGWSAAGALPHSDDEIRGALGGVYHAAGTCALGTVLDPDCRVRGYAGLRVCDASIMPSLPRANPYLTVVAMAERLAAQLIAS